MGSGDLSNSPEMWPFGGQKCCNSPTGEGTPRARSVVRENRSPSGGEEPHFWVIFADFLSVEQGQNKGRISIKWRFIGLLEPFFFLFFRKNIALSCGNAPEIPSKVVYFREKKGVFVLIFVGRGCDSSTASTSEIFRGIW